jgi:hypothetical protein
VDDQGAVNRGDEDTLKMQAQVTKALRPAYEELARALPEQRRLGIDESPTKEAGAKSWLRTFVAGLFTVFAARGTRAATVLSEFLTDAFAGGLPSMRSVRRLPIRKNLVTRRRTSGLLNCSSPTGRTSI